MTYDPVNPSLMYEDVLLMETSWAADGWVITKWTVRKVRADYQLEVTYTLDPTTPGGSPRVFTEILWKEATYRWKPCAISISSRQPAWATVTWWRRPETPQSATSSSTRQTAMTEAAAMGLPPPFPQPIVLPRTSWRRLPWLQRASRSQQQLERPQQ